MLRINNEFKHNQQHITDDSKAHLAMTVNVNKYLLFADKTNFPCIILQYDYIGITKILNVYEYLKNGIAIHNGVDI